MTTLDKALRELNRGNIKEGLRILEALRFQESENPDVLYNLGICYSERGELERSIEALEQCVEMAPDHANAYAALGFSYARSGHSEKAMKVLEEALRKDPDNPYVLKNLGSLYGKVNQLDKAIECLEHADRVQPDTPEILYGLAYAYEQKGEDQKADEHYQRIVEVGEPSDLVDLAKEARTRVGVDTLKAEGLRPDVVMYCMAAMEKFEDLDRSQVREIAFEIAMLGQTGLEIHNPSKTYRLDSLPGEYTGLQLLSYMYVGFQIIDPSVDVGADLSDEYQAALKMSRP